MTNEKKDENKMSEEEKELRELMKQIDLNETKVFNSYPHDLTYNYHNGTFNNEEIDKERVLRYLKGIYGSNKERFRHYFINKIADPFADTIIEYFMENFDEVEPFSYKEAFKLEENGFQALVFSSINITEMIEELGNERIATEGKEVTRKTYDKEGNYMGEVTYHNVYEVHKVDGTKLDAREELYALKCWCTSTNQEHWLWLDKRYDDPLEAVASTFRVYENMVDYIKEIKRQGDVLICEMTQEVTPSGNLVPLSKEQYFGLLTAET